MTKKHYAQASSVSNVRTARVDQLLTSGRAAEPMGEEVTTQLVQKMSPQQREEMMNAMSLLHQNALPSNPQHRSATVPRPVFCELEPSLYTESVLRLTR
jgi:hypothetical protein